MKIWPCSLMFNVCWLIVTISIRYIIYLFYLFVISVEKLVYVFNHVSFCHFCFSHMYNFCFMRSLRNLFLFSFHYLCICLFFQPFLSIICCMEVFFIVNIVRIKLLLSIRSNPMRRFNRFSKKIELEGIVKIYIYIYDYFRIGKIREGFPECVTVTVYI